MQDGWTLILRERPNRRVGRMNIASAAPPFAARQFAFLTLLALLATFLGACSERLPPQEPLPDLSLPGVTQIPRVTTLHRGVGRAWIGSVATAQAGPADRTPLAIFSLDGDLYRIGFDGSDPALIENTCGNSGNRSDARPASTTADGRWLLCDTNRLTLIPLPAAGSEATEHELHLLRLSGKENPHFPGRVTLSPNGRYLLLLTDDESGGCGVAFYELSAAHDNATLVAFLTIPGVISDGGFNGCGLSDPAWSPPSVDGSWLAFTRFGSGKGWGTFAFPLRPFLASIDSVAGHPMRLIVDPAQLIGLVDIGKDPLSPCWTLGPDRLQLNYIRGSIEQVSLATRQTRTIVTLPNRGQIDALAATPDNHGLIFAHGTIPLCPDCQAGETPSHLYIYTPADA
jgi:hypothetical protein